MKSLTTLSIIGILGFSLSCKAQTNEKPSKTDAAKPMNLLDEQVKIYGGVFDLAGAGTDNPLSGSTNYLEAIESMDATEAQKENLREQYYQYDSSLTVTEKDSLGKVLNDSINQVK
ncbi:hypothetical protein LCGC14_1852320, partial [marine sediment metagenome]